MADLRGLTTRALGLVTAGADDGEVRSGGGGGT